MRAVIISIICRCLAYLAVLAFVFGIVHTTKNTKYLWLLLLIMTVYFIPTYECKGIANTDNNGNKSPKIDGNPFDI